MSKSNLPPLTDEERKLKIADAAIEWAVLLATTIHDAVSHEDWLEQASREAKAKIKLFELVREYKNGDRDE